MKDITYAIITLLKADTGVAGVAGTRVHRKKLPTSPTFPAITVAKIDNIRDVITNTAGYAHARIQCTTWTTTPGPEEDLAETIANALNQKQNSILLYGTGANASAVYIKCVKDAGGIPDENEEIPLYMEHRDFMIEYDYR